MEFQPAREQLIALLLKLFRGGELERFARHAFGKRIALAIDKYSDQIQAVQLVDELYRQGMVNDRLFELMAKSRPEQEQLIRRVRREALGETKDRIAETQEEGGGGEPAPRGRGRDRSESAPARPESDEAAQWRSRLQAVLKRSQPRAKSSRPWVEAAAVLPHFDPVKLHPVGGQQEALGNSLVTLAAECDARPDGRWQLRLPVRQETIARLWKEKRILEALETNPKETSEHTRLLREIVDRGRIPVASLTGYRRLRAAREVGEWLSRTDAAPFDRDVLAAMFERQERIAPLRLLAGKHFRGRVQELKRLRAHLDASGEDGRILSVVGIGGVGKSALLGKLLLELEKAKGFPRPWVYLDFDDPAVEPTNPRRLVELIARQLSLLYADPAASAAFAGLESAAGGDRALSFTLDLGDDPSLKDWISALDKSIRRLPIQPSLVIVLDTFEQVQVRGGGTAGLVRTLVDALLESTPYTQIIVSGRARVWEDAAVLELDDLDEASAEQVLRVLGVQDRELRRKILQHVGGNPLSLRLAADAVKAGQLGPADLEELVASARRLELQGQLYTRILGHIGDGEVRRLAHPGLIVRRVTPGVIRDVLAEMCQVDRQNAEALFDRLRRHVALFEPDETAPDEERALRHRQDVRERMLRLMIEDPTWKGRLNQVHDRAVSHYRGRSHPVTRAEELYHRLMRGDDFEKLDSLWSDELAGSLTRSWGEPLPEKARLWLGPRIGRTGYDAKGLRLAEWEMAAAREVRTLLDAGDAEGALAILSRRRKRTEGSPLVRLEIRALMQLKRYPRARKLLDAALAEAVRAERLDEILKLRLLGAEMARSEGELEALREHAQRAVFLASTLNNTAAELEAREMLVRAGSGSGEPEAIEENALQLEGLFARADAKELRQASQISARIVQSLGPQSKHVLRKAAVTFGNRSDQDLIDLDAFKLEELLGRAVETDEGKTQVSKLAGEVGLSESDFSLIDLASQAIRHGRLGDALATVLDQAGDREDVRAKTFEMFHHEDVAS